MNTVLVVQHEEQCPPAWFGTWLAELGCTLDVRLMSAGDELSGSLEEFDRMVILGGTMSAKDDMPWYPPLRTLIHEAIERAVPTLGICLGHQLLGVTLGGRVIRNPRGQAMGIHQVGWTSEAHDDVLLGSLTDQLACVQWNNDIVSELPPGGTMLAATPDGDAQSIRFGPACWGVQWHPEADEHVVAPWGDGDRVVHGDERVDAAIAGVAAQRDDLLHAWRRLAVNFAAL